MVYKNFIMRIISSIFFILIYFFISVINFNLVFYFIILIYIFIIAEIYLYFKIFKLLPFIYTLLSFLFFLQIDFHKSSYHLFNLFIFVVISFDIFSYFIGKIIGRKTFISVSPNKTIEGLIGGIISAFSVSILFSYVLKIDINLKILVFILLIILFAFIGDIIESFFKRKNNLKNSSEFIPGHGGVFDRFDSFLFSIILYSIFNIIEL